MNHKKDESIEEKNERLQKEKLKRDEINYGIKKLKTLLPENLLLKNQKDIDKRISKANILNSSAIYIKQLEIEKDELKEKIGIYHKINNKKIVLPSLIPQDNSNHKPRLPSLSSIYDEFDTNNQYLINNYELKNINDNNNKLRNDLERYKLE